MPGHQEVSIAAAGLHISAEILVDFDRKGWIKTVEKNGMVYLTADQRYRAKYILHLRDKKHLSDEQIELVLSVQRPPYSAAQVDEILRNQPPAPVSGKAAGQKQPRKEERAKA